MLLLLPPLLEETLMIALSRPAGSTQDVILHWLVHEGSLRFRRSHRLGCPVDQISTDRGRRWVDGPVDMSAKSFFPLRSLTAIRTEGEKGEWDL